jgi:hypothetical protein
MVKTRSALRVVRSALLGLVATAACKPDLQQAVSIVSRTQILATRAEPAEGAPKAEIHYDALVADSSGPVNAPVDWAFCNEREPLAELGPVSPKCYQPTGSWFSPVGTGPQVTGTLPVLGCREFGPEVPEPQAKQPPGRPVDPDATGGYYQPLRILVPSSSGEVIGIAETRLTCGLAGTPDQVLEFSHHDVANVNPAIDSLTSGTKLFSTDERGATNEVTAGQSLSLEVSWAQCPLATGACGNQFCDLTETQSSCPDDCATLAGCTGAETYVNLDLVTHSLVTQREGMQVSWFATAGAFDHDQTGTDPSDLANSTANTWRAPNTAGMVHLWAVLRDDRGGTGWAEYLLDVK